MIRAVLLWMRRSSMAVAFPAMVAVAVAAAWSRPGWQYEWDWALSWTASGTVLLGPIVAGLVAHDRARRHAPTLTQVERCGGRGLPGSLSLPVAGFVLGFAAWLVAAAAAAVRVARHDPLGTPQLSIFLEVGCVLAAAAFIGAAIGSWITSRAAGPLAALAVYASFVLAPHLRLGGVLEAGGSLDTLVDLRRPVAWLVGFVAVHLAIVVAGVLVVAARRVVVPWRRSTALAGAALVVVLGSGAFVVGTAGKAYDSVAVGQICLGTAPVVCGPAASRRVLEIAEVGLRKAYAALSDSGLPLRDRYDMGRGTSGRPFPEDARVLSADPSGFEDGALSRSELLLTVGTPTLCAEYAGERPSDDLFDAAQVVRGWLASQLSGTRRGSAPAEVARSYDLLKTCAPYRGGR